MNIGDMTMRYKDNIDKIEQQIADMVRDAPVERETYTRHQFFRR